MTCKKYTFAPLGLEVEIGRFADQADGSVWSKWGETVIISAATAAREEREFMGFLPLTVEHRERLAAAGKIPGGYIKREGRPSDQEVLTSRIIDRTIRPLFPKFYFNEVQLFSTLLSYSGNTPIGIQAIIGASLAFQISEIPLAGAIGAVQASFIDGEWQFNLDVESTEKAGTSVVVAGTEGGICMVEGRCDNLAEKDIIDLLVKAQELIKEQVAWQNEVRKDCGKTKLEPSAKVEWKKWQALVHELLPSDLESKIFNVSKTEFTNAISSARSTVLAGLEKEISSGEVSATVVKYLFEDELRALFPDLIAKQNIRFDGRSFETVRPIGTEVGLLPCTHGSALFQRGATQVLSSISLGTAGDAQRLETLSGNKEKPFMLHYNFPPYCVGDVRPVRGVSRREIGHGNLAEMSFARVMPSQEDFPYAIRAIADVLACNGSSSMGTVCATTLGLMDAGVPISDVVGGVAIGLMRDSEGKLRVLTDILGSEDAFGLMDLKVTGTKKGVMGIQMDIKDSEGLSREILGDAFNAAKKARIHIIEEMEKTISEPRKTVSDRAPQVLSTNIPTDKIGVVIGPGGKMIKEIVAKTGAEIDINDDGTVRIYAQDKDKAEKAESWIRALVGDIDVNSEFDGIIRRFVDFGIFVELVPGCDGLVHISAIAKDKQRTLQQQYETGQKLRVRVTANDRSTGRIRLVAPELER
ncbi:polyribonucleotide nucleotidyltransferase [bacterium]|nr:polyribonucleotide nucleotidyltransferase [bacterium]